MNSLYFVVLSFLFLLLHSHAERPHHDELSPEYKYMDHLRQIARTLGIKGSYIDDSEPNDQAPGTLLAASFNDTRKNSKRSRLDIGGSSATTTLEFTVPQQKEIKAIGKSEIWLFPSFDTPLTEGSGWYRLDLALIITLKDFNNPVEADKTVYWNTDECIMIDVTGQTKAIARKLSKRQLNKTDITVEVSIINKRKLIRDLPRENEWQQTCAALSPERSNNNSFLVVKYYSDKEVNSSSSSSSRSTVEKRTVKKRNIDAFNASGGCSLSPFVVDLEVIYGDWVVSPKEEVDIKVCTGTCDIVDDFPLFSSRAFLKDRIRNAKETLTVPSEMNLDVSCVALTFEPLALLIYVDDDKYYALVDFPITATSCGCR